MQLKENLRDYTFKEKDRNRNKEYNILKKEFKSLTFEEAYDIIEEPIFCGCGSKAKFISLKLGYSKYCSYNCLHKDNFYTLENIKNNILNKTFNNTNIATALKIYNLTSKEMYDKLFGSSKCKHCDNEASYDNLLNGYRQYCSVKCSSYYKDLSRTLEKNAEIQEKRKKTMFEKYGVEHNFKLFNNSDKNNIMSSKNKSINSINAKEKKRKTMLEKYGRINTNYAEYIINRDDLNEEFILKNFIKNKKFDVYSAMNHFNCSRTYFNKFNLPKQVNYGEEWIFEITNGIRNNRKLISPLEIDILIEEQKLAIEFNGMMFHSSGKQIGENIRDTDKNYHLRKTELVEEKGYQLFHIFESEFLDFNKKEIWESVIRNKLKLNNKLYARKCIIKEVKNKESNEFLEQNHLQGKCVCSIRLGLYYNDELVSLITFGKSRYNKNIEYELIRFCSKKNTTIIGAGNKLLKYFENTYKPKSLISYANRRWSQGNIYEQLGFKFINSTNPNYFYFKKSNDKLLSRVQFQKHKLKDKLEKFDLNKTEIENMIENGYRVIYDSGNKVYIKEYSE